MQLASLHATDIHPPHTALHIDLQCGFAAAHKRTLTCALAQASQRAKCKEEAWQAYHAGQVRALVDERRFQGLDSIPDAVDHMLSGAAIGKVVVAL